MNPELPGDECRVSETGGRKVEEMTQPGVPVLCPGWFAYAGFRWALGPGNACISLVLGPHNAEVEGSSPSLTTNRQPGRSRSPLSANATGITPAKGVIAHLRSWQHGAC